MRESAYIESTQDLKKMERFEAGLLQNAFPAGKRGHFIYDMPLLSMELAGPI